MSFFFHNFLCGFCCEFEFAWFENFLFRSENKDDAALFAKDSRAEDESDSERYSS